MSSPFQSVYATSYKAPAEGQNLNSTSPKITRVNNESHILANSGIDVHQPSYTYKTEYNGSYSPPRQKLQATNSFLSKSKKASPASGSPVQASSTSSSSPTQTSNAPSTPVAPSTPLRNESDPNFYDPAANSGVETPQQTNQGLNETNKSGRAESNSISSQVAKQGFLTEYARSYSPQRDKRILESSGKLTENNQTTSALPPPSNGGEGISVRSQGGEGGGRAEGSPTAKSPYYRTEYGRQYSPSQDKKKRDEKK